MEKKTHHEANAHHAMKASGDTNSRRSTVVSASLAALLLLTGCSGLPDATGRSHSSALTDTGRTKMGMSVRPKLASHPGQSGLHPLADPRDAFAVRLALADAAERSLDVQYYIWNSDMAGKVLMERLYRAADRGVRVRMLLDDVGTMPSDSVLHAIDSHPNIELRMYNPANIRTPRMLGILAELGRMNRRMHNKSFIADSQVAIVGGRNIGDEYFGADTESNFADHDVAIIGPAVQEASDEFDLYWNHAAAVPMAEVSHRKTTPGQITAQRADLAAFFETARHSDYAEDVRQTVFLHEIQQHKLKFLWGRATIINDHPDKTITAPSKTETHMAPQLRELASQTSRELYLVSPYFVPGKGGVDYLSEVRRRGARVVVITNSLASTDGIPVHSRYRLYRKPLLEAGVELYELKPTSNAGSKHHVGRSSGGSLHAKTFSFDRRVTFIGSYNLDPRSNRLNTEMGVVIDCPELARRLPETVDPDLARAAYRVELDDGRLVWATQEDGEEVRYHHDPKSSWCRRAKAFIIGFLPIEKLL